MHVIAAAPVEREAGAAVKFAFEAAVWPSAVRTMVLTTNYRQKDPKLIALLDEIRVGVVTPESVAILRACVHARARVRCG